MDNSNMDIHLNNRITLRPSRIHLSSPAELPSSQQLSSAKPPVNNRPQQEFINQQQQSQYS
jgi:hypothetical protein